MYWLSRFLVELVLYTIVLMLVLAILVAAQVHPFVQNNLVGALLIFVPFGLVSIMVGYSLSFMFQRVETATSTSLAFDIHRLATRLVLSSAHPANSNALEWSSIVVFLIAGTSHASLRSRAPSLPLIRRHCHQPKAIPQMVLPTIYAVYGDPPGYVTYLLCVIPYYALYVALWRFSILGYSSYPLTLESSFDPDNEIVIIAAIMLAEAVLLFSAVMYGAWNP